jgi:8-oxo-dGTP diphosphatase
MPGDRDSKPARKVRKPAPLPGFEEAETVSGAAQKTGTVPVSGEPRFSTQKLNVPVPTLYPDAPRVAIGALVMRGGKLLVVERGKAPAEGVWALPGGSVELGETLAEATEREVLEETGVVVRAGAVVHAFDAVVRDDDGRVRFHYVIVDLACEYVSGEAVAGCDARSARFVSREEFALLRSSRATVDLLRRITSFLSDEVGAPGAGDAGKPD